MILDIYVVWSVINFFLFFVALTDLIKLTKGTRMTLMMISAILFFIVALSSFNIEDVFCSYSGGWQCTTQIINDSSLGILNIGFGILSVLYIITEAFGWIPKEVKEGVNIE